MKVLVYTMANQGYQEICQLDAAAEYISRGDEVLVLTCDKEVGICSENRLKNKVQCTLCLKAQRRRIQNNLGRDVLCKSISDYMDDELKKEAKTVTFSYKSTDDIRSIKYKGIEIGYGVLSSYISWTRNLNPEISDEIKRYFDELLYMQVKMVLAIEKVLDDFKPDLVVFHNGRYSHYKPLLGIAESHNIQFICTEALMTPKKQLQRNFFENGIPHSPEANIMNYNNLWNSCQNQLERDACAKSFFNNRRYGKYAGDKIYTKAQKLGELPEGWNDEKENIVIFNSSEDEFGAVGSCISKYAIWNSQIEGITAIMDKYKDDDTKVFYLRIHPNLIGIPYDYHMDLYKLHYNNLIIIPGESKISTYTLMDKASKVIVFGSTAGVEATYWGVPTICLGSSMYRNLDVSYNPSTPEEVWALIETVDLKPKSSNNALKYGLYYMSENHIAFNYIKLQMSSFMFCKKQFTTFSIYKLLGSEKLYALYYYLRYNIKQRCSLLSKFNKMPGII